MIKVSSSCYEDCELSPLLEIIHRDIRTSISKFLFGNRRTRSSSSFRRSMYRTVRVNLTLVMTSLWYLSGLLIRAAAEWVENLLIEKTDR